MTWARRYSPTQASPVAPSSSAHGKPCQSSKAVSQRTRRLGPNSKQAGETAAQSKGCCHLLPLLEAEGSSENRKYLTTYGQAVPVLPEDSAADPPQKRPLRTVPARCTRASNNFEHRPCASPTARKICQQPSRASVCGIRKYGGTAGRERRWNRNRLQAQRDCLSTPA